MGEYATKSVSGRGVDPSIVSFLQIGHLKPAFFVHYLQKDSIDMITGDEVSG